MPSFPSFGFAASVVLLVVVLIVLSTTVFSIAIGFVPYAIVVTLSGLLTLLVWRTYGDAQEGRELHLRMAASATAVAGVIYATGWGPALTLAFVVVIADNVRLSGARVTRLAVDWSMLLIGIAHFGIQLEWVPSLMAVPQVHGVGLLGVLALVVATERLRRMTVEKEQAEAEVAARERRFAALVSRSSDVTLVIDRDGRVIYQSPAARQLGYEPDSLLGTELAELVHPDDVDEIHDTILDLDLGEHSLVECRVRTEDDEWIEMESSCTNRLDDPEIAGYVINARDITDRKDLEAQLHHRAFHDALTGLANRHLFRDRVEHATSLATRRREDTFAVLFCDLDGFKTINDTLGHQTGDQLLKVIANRIQQAVRDHDTAARLGGDEFAVLVEYITETADAARVAERILDEVRRPLQVEDQTVNVDCSIGIAVSAPDSRATTDELLRNADIAMYMAKGAGKGRYEVFEPSMHVAVVERLQLEADLQRALDEEQLELHYQPIVDLDSGGIDGVEALIRWRHPDRGLVSPGEFIPLAEETGLIVPIGRWVLEEACRQIAVWQKRFPGDPELKVNVNVSTRQLTHGDLLEDVQHALESSGLPAESLVLEITESDLLSDNQDSMALFGELKARGVRLAVDDFGTGYSSLAYLRDFPFDILKIDRSFIDGLTRGTQNPAVVRAIIELGRSLELETVAEGIEHDEQLSRFRELHCNKGQGFLFARPGKGAEVEALLAVRRGIAEDVLGKITESELRSS